MGHPRPGAPARASLPGLQRVVAVTEVRGPKQQLVAIVDVSQVCHTSFDEQRRADEQDSHGPSQSRA